MTTFKLYGNLEPLIGNVPTVELEAETIRIAVAELTKRFPALIGELVDEDGEYNRYYSALVNGEMMEFLDDLDTTITPDDEVTFFPPIAA